MDPVKIEDDGFLPVQLGDTAVTIDLFDVYNRLVEIQEECAGKSARERNAATVEYMQSLGFPRASHAAAVAFTNAIYKAAEDRKKKGPAGESASRPPDSADCTDSPSGD